jgi:DNA-binding GntR family transcriptional regulator
MSPNQSKRKVVASAGHLSNLPQEAYLVIKNSIMNNEVKPGDCLSENALSQTMGMSRTPIREAFKVLASEGLIEIHNGVGAFVKYITVKEIHDIFEVRSALECTAVNSALDRITDSELEILEQDWLKMKSEVLSGTPIGWDVLSEYDYRLHEFLVKKCDNDYIIDIIDNSRMKITRFQKISAVSLGNEIDTINQHLELIRLMKSRDADALKKELIAHIQLAENLNLKNPNVKY